MVGIRKRLTFEEAMNRPVKGFRHGGGCQKVTTAADGICRSEYGMNGAGAHEAEGMRLACGYQAVGGLQRGSCSEKHSFDVPLGWIQGSHIKTFLRPQVCRGLLLFNLEPRNHENLLSFYHLNNGTITPVIHVIVVVAAFGGG